MKRFFSALLCVIGLSSPAAALPISSSEFTLEFVKVLGSEAPSLKVIVKNDMELLIRDSAGKESTAFLDNAFSEYLLDPKSKTEVIKKYVLALLESRNEETPVDRSRIVPVVKDRPWLIEMREALKARGGKKIAENVYDDLNDELVVIYAEDSPKNIKYLSPENIATNGIRKDELRSIAVANLKKILPEINIQ